MVLRKCITELDSINLSSDLVTAFISISRKLVISYFREDTDGFYSSITIFFLGIL